jgi:hypothetical protein
MSVDVLDRVDHAHHLSMSHRPPTEILHVVTADRVILAEPADCAAECRASIRKRPVMATTLEVFQQDGGICLVRECQKMHPVT